MTADRSALSLAKHLTTLIEHDGLQRLDRVMALALSHPRAGYYRKGRPIGAAGDFITAPEISQLFGEMLGIYVLQTYIELGEPKDWQIVEFGPGRGTLIADIIRTLKIRPQALAALRLHMIETSEDLGQDQKTNITAVWGGEVSWHQRFDKLPERPSVIIANEFFDALPIRQFLFRRGHWLERHIGLTGEGAFADRFLPAARPIDALPENAAEGDVFEFAPEAVPLLERITAHLVAAGGRALLVDYGYETWPRGPTFQAIRGHKMVEPLAHLGAADLTAHVDFGRLAAVARMAGATVVGPLPQGLFLTHLGIHARRDRLAAGASTAARQILDQGLERLTAPEAMGDLFRVLSIQAPGLPPPPGFYQG